MAEIKQLTEVELPKWTKRRKELEEIIKRARAAQAKNVSQAN